MGRYCGPSSHLKETNKKTKQRRAQISTFKYLQRSIKPDSQPVPLFSVNSEEFMIPSLTVTDHAG